MAYNNYIKDIVLIDDDEDDHNLFMDALDELGLKFKVNYFGDADEAFEYLGKVTSYPFLIVCDVNMPGTNGFEFKKLLNARNDEMLNSTPFIFITTSPDPSYLRHAQMLNIQGYFIKPTSYNELKNLILKIVNYWEVSAYDKNLTIND